MKSLEDLIQAAAVKGESAVDLLRHSQTGPNVYPGVPPEFTNWRDEQQAWQKACVLFNLSFHMADLLVEGRDAVKLLSQLGINSFKNLALDRAKQFVPCSHDGHVIGDVILFPLAADRFNLVGRIPALEWVQFHAKSGAYDVKLELDDRSAARKDPFNRKSYRFQIQGPNAMKVMEKVLGRQAPQIKFFHLCGMTIAGKPVGGLRHGMVGQPGFELFGPYAEGEAVREAIVRAGEEFGLRQVGGRAYSSNTLESGWLPSPLPATFTGASQMMKDFRAWAGGKSYAGICSIGGSYVPNSIEGYYLTPWDIGYGHIVKFDHDFVGREALERMAGETHKTKVTLALDPEDVLRVMSSLYSTGDRAKYIEFPSAVYAMHPFDDVKCDGKSIGVSTWIGYSSNEGAMLSLAMIDPEYVEFGKEVTLVWGEPGGGTSKPTVEPHVQTEIKAIVSPVPFSAVARNAYADSWRQTGKGASG